MTERERESESESKAAQHGVEERRRQQHVGVSRECRKLLMNET